MSPDRKLHVSIQDFCNILGGGLVSYSTLSAKCVQAALEKRVGTLICIYDWKPSDVMGAAGTGALSAADEDASQPAEGSVHHRFLAICWRCAGRTLNVMCSKTGEEPTRLSDLLYALTLISFYIVEKTFSR